MLENCLVIDIYVLIFNNCSVSVQSKAGDQFSKKLLVGLLIQEPVNKEPQ